MEYPKINSLWKRAEDHNFIEGDYSCPEFASINKWRVQEKIDGTNVRVHIYRYRKPENKTEAALINAFEPKENIYLASKMFNSECSIEIHGRTNKAQLNQKLIDFIWNKHFETKLDLFPINGEVYSTVLFGEGFGAGIQSGGIYRNDISFILFDVYMGGRWSTREEVKHLANLLELETPHDFGMMTQDEIISFIKSKPRGMYGANTITTPKNIFIAAAGTGIIVKPSPNYILEGIVARSEPLVRFNNNQASPVMWKLKVKDFKGD